VCMLGVCLGEGGGSGEASNDWGAVLMVCMHDLDSRWTYSATVV